MLRDDGILLKESWYDELKTINTSDVNYVIEFENAMNKYTGFNYCVGTTNGTAAILTSLLAMGVKENDEVIIPSYSHIAARVVCENLKLNIKYCDVNLNTLCMDVDCLKKIINKNTKVVIFIGHLGYIGKELIKIKELCVSNEVLLLEDAGQGLSQIYDGKMAGTIGDIGMYSFSGAKLLRCGEGGCLVTNSRYYHDSIKTYINMGIGNYVMSPISAKLTTIQLRDIDIILDARNRIHAIYKKHLNIIQHDNDSNSINAIAYISSKAEDINAIFKSKNIETRYKYYPAMNNDVNATILYNNHIELPQSNNLSESDIIRICTDINNIEKITNKRYGDKLTLLMSRVMK